MATKQAEGETIRAAVGHQEWWGFTRHCRVVGPAENMASDLSTGLLDSQQEVPLEKVGGCI